MALQSTLEFLPHEDRPESLFIVLHGFGDTAEGMLGLAGALSEAFPKAAVLIPQGFQPSPYPGGRQWFPLEGVNDDTRPERVAEVMPQLAAYIREQQDRFGILNPDTALVGFSQGGIMALELSVAHDGLVGRVVAFAARFAQLPQRAPVLTTIHLLHGDDDDVMPVAHAWAAFEQLTQLKGDATLDTASGVEHFLHPAMVQCAIDRLQTTIPLRTWQRALGGQ